MADLISEVKKIFESNQPYSKRLKFAVACCIAAVLLLIITDSFSGCESNSDKEKFMEKSLETFDLNSYETELERSLEEILSRISGVGDVTVMLTVSGTSETVYAVDSDTSASSDSVQNRSSIIIIEKSDEKEALVSKIKKPEINGVAVICEGGDNAHVKEKIVNTVSTVLGISSSRVCVEGC